MKRATMACLAIAFSSLPALACGIETDCRIGERTYRIALPDAVPEDRKIGAIVFAHGYRGRAEGVMRNKGLLRLAKELGVAFVAVQSAGEDWSIPGAPSHSRRADVDELAYFDRVVEDMTTRFPIDRDRLMATGFSAGGMMVWNLACFRGALFAGFAPMSGTFWEPIPQKCPGAPVNLFHYHGTKDAVVPISGRAIADTRQGDVRAAADLLIRAGNYRPAPAATLADPGPNPDLNAGLDCARSQATQRQTGKVKIFDLCLHAGKHGFKTQFLKRSWSILKEIGAL